MLWAVDEDGLLKDFLTDEQIKAVKENKAEPDKTKVLELTREKEKKTPADKDIRYRPGFKSKVDLECLNKTHAKFEFRVTVEKLTEWLAKCRNKTDKRCRKLKSHADPPCLTRTKTLYQFVLLPAEEAKIKSACSEHQLSCPIETESQ